MNVTMPIDKTRRKRLKVVSACGECRRKKTKCNGESPCIGCIKAKVECKYITSHKARAMARQAPVSASSTVTSGSNSSNNNSYNVNGMNQSSSNNNSKPTVEAIEERLGVIEDILRALLKQGQENGGTPPPPPPAPSSYSLPVFDSSASCGGGYHHPLPPSTTRGGVHASHVQNWRFARDPIAPTPRRPNGSGSAFHLPPLTSSSSISSACSLSSSSSTSTTSSASSTSGGPAIRNLLNDQDIDLPTPPPTASFHKEGHAYYRYHYQSENNL
ncbi:predicted protein [Lichtheimia corymbifera JMRC:FSU:9682]|uniref:Zn(2)-C6 fungal-type domain-containing protein n=1 Tax=Lichtheimia corymbifera JMRC:FSU:9682 TaxID=1263082 RepID=A0A068RMW9_9FUNG|nr:predicted protein [Lichtheimia corymbifera JMRC:FSU:9682]